MARASTSRRSMACLFDDELSARHAIDVEQFVDDARQVLALPIDGLAHGLDQRVIEIRRPMSATALRIGASGLRNSCASIAMNSCIRCAVSASVSACRRCDKVLGHHVVRAAP